MSSAVGFSGRFLRLSGADIWRTLNIERETLNIEIRDTVPSLLQRSMLGVRCSMFDVHREFTAKGAEGREVFLVRCLEA